MRRTSHVRCRPSSRRPAVTTCQLRLIDEAIYKCMVFVDVDFDTISPPIPKQPNQPAEQRINLLRVNIAFTPPARNVASMEDVTAKDPIIHATIPRY